MSLPFDLGTGAAVWLLAATFVASFVRGYSGFGFAALLVAATGLVTNPLYAVPVVILGDIATAVLQMRGIWGRIDWKRVAALFAGAFPGAPIGIYLLSSVGVDLARAVISVFILAMCLLLWVGWQFHRTIGAGPTAGVGFVSGFINGAGVGGLPVAVFLAAQPIAAGVFRATLIAYFALMDVWSLPLMARAGMITTDTFVALALVFPVMTLGIWLGARRFLNAEPASFRQFAILLLAVLATLGLLKSVF